MMTPPKRAPKPSKTCEYNATDAADNAKTGSIAAFGGACAYLLAKYWDVNDPGATVALTTICTALAHVGYRFICSNESNTSR